MRDISQNESIYFFIHISNNATIFANCRIKKLTFLIITQSNLLIHVSKNTTITCFADCKIRENDISLK